MSKFIKGLSGNPGGRPKKSAELVAAAREITVTALDTLASIMSNERAPAAARVAAAREILDRGWGRPTLDVRLEAELTATINVQAFIRPRTYEEWLQLRTSIPVSGPLTDLKAVTDDRRRPLLLAGDRSKSVGDDVG